MQPLMRGWGAGLVLAIPVLAIYYLERVEGIRGLRPLFGAALVVCFWYRCLWLGRVARDGALLLRPTAMSPEDAGRPLDVACTASVFGLGIVIERLLT